jgi:hypothetical protein
MLTPPLDTAACLYRAQAYSPDNTMLPNEGTRQEPLLLGASLSSEPVDPVFTADSAIGDHLRFAPGQGCHARAMVPPAVLQGDFTFAVRYRPEAAWTLRFLATVIDQNPEVKHFYLHVATDNKVMARVFDSSASHAQVIAQGTAGLSTSKTYTIIVTWDSQAKTLRLFIDGAQAAQAVSAHPRSVPLASPLYLPYPGANSTAGKFFAWGYWQRALSSTEVTMLTDNADWLAAGGSGTPPPPPPPPPAPPVVTLTHDGQSLPTQDRQTSIVIDGQALDLSGKASVDITIGAS